MVKYEDICMSIDKDMESGGESLYDENCTNDFIKIIQSKLTCEYEFVDHVNKNTGIYNDELHFCSNGIEVIYNMDGLDKVLFSIKTIFKEYRVYRYGLLDVIIDNIINYVEKRKYKIVDGKYMFDLYEHIGENMLIEFPIIHKSIKSARK